MAEAVTPPNPAGLGGGKGNERPIPDPTLLTIDLTRREIAMIENLMDVKIEAALDRIEASHKLDTEKFRRVDDLMERAEKMRQEQKQDTSKAVDAALNSQEQATHKMEKSISDQVTALQNNFATEVRSIRGSLEDQKLSISRIESTKQGQTEQKTETRQVNAGLIALVMVGVTIVLAVLTVIAFFAGGGGGLAG